MTLPYSHSFLLHWPLPTPFQPGSLTSVLVEPIWERLARHSHPAALRILDPRCLCCTVYQIHPLPCNCVHRHLDYPSHHSSWANFWYLKCVQVRYYQQFLLDDGWFLSFRGHLISEFVLQEGPCRPRQWQKRSFGHFKCSQHHDVQRVARMPWWFLPCPKGIPRLSSACFGR